MKRGHSVFIACVSLVWACAVAAYGFVWTVDPYELRSAREGERLAPHSYPEEVTPRLAPAAAAEGVDVAIVGGSTAMGYTPAMMRRAFPDARRPANLAYPCATGDDLALILRRLEASPRLAHLVISLDFTLMWWCVGVDSPLDRRYFSPSWFDPVPEFNLDSVELSREVLRTHVLDLPSWRPRLPDRVDGVNFAPALDTKVADLADIQRDIAARRNTIASAGVMPCSAVPSLSKDIFPYVRRLAARGVSVDLVAPPYSLPFYFQRGEPTERHEVTGNLFARLMTIRRCALELSAGIHGVRFYSFDTDLSIVGDLSLYSDVGHIRDYGVYDRILHAIAAGDGTVRPGQWGVVEARLKSELASFAADPSAGLTQPGSGDSRDGHNRAGLVGQSQAGLKSHLSGAPAVVAARR